MLSNEPSRQNTNLSQVITPLKCVRNRVILPDGSQNEPLGSGFITGLLGVGGMATVYEIWNPKLELSRAVKLLHPNCNEETKQRFDTEIKITAKLHHANIVEIHVVGMWNELPYIEMERIDGKTIEALILERGAFPIEVCTAIGIMIGRALRYAHNQEYVIYGKTYHGVIHRDIKPSNIMISNRGILKLMDFGIARPTDTSIHTTDGSILGTMQYLSPEQLEGKEPDIRTDIYSLGAVFYEMITGQKAFSEKNAAQLMLSRLKNDFKSLNCYDLKIPARLRNLVHRCMMKDRDKRIKDASSFLAEISLIHKSLTSLSPEQVLKQFIGAIDVSKKVLSTRYVIPSGLLIKILLTGLTVSAIGIGLKMKPLLTNVEKYTPEADTAKISITDSISKPVNINGIEKVSKVSKGKLKTEQNSELMITKKVNTQPTMIEQLCATYGTSDLSVIFVQEVKNHHYESSLEIFNALNPEQRATSKVIIYKIRALKKLQLNSELKQLLMCQELDDAEFYIEKARCFVDDENANKALHYLQFASQRPAAFVENNLIRLERLYLTARCKSLEFDAKPSVEFKNSALESWYELKAELQTSKDHPYFKEAGLQMQRITQKMNSSKGQL